MDSELSLIRFNIINFFSLVLNSRPFSPITTTQMKIVEALIYSEPEPDKEILSRLQEIRNTTHVKVRTPLPIVELAVFRNLDKGLNREIEIGGKSFYLIELYKYMDEVSQELVKIVVELGKKYNVDIPINAQINQSQKISLE